MNKVSVLIIAAIAALAVFLYWSKVPDPSDPSTDADADAAAATSTPSPAPAPTDTGGDRPATQVIEPETFRAQDNLPPPATEQLTEARLNGITFLHRRALRGDQPALETLRRLIKAGDASFRLEAVELLSRSADPGVQQEIMTLLEKPALSDDDVDDALLMIIGTFADIEEALALEEPADSSSIRRRDR